MDKEGFCRYYPEVSNNPVFERCFHSYMVLEQCQTGMRLKNEEVAFDLIRKSI